MYLGVISLKFEEKNCVERPRQNYYAQIMRNAECKSYYMIKKNGEL